MDKIVQKDKHKKAKAKLLIIVSVVVGLLLLLIIASIMIDHFEKIGEDTERVIDYNFYPPDYDENIFEDPEYLSLIESGFMQYHDSTTGVTSGITRENAEKHNGEVKFIVDMLYKIIYGDHRGYNEFFSKKYYEAHTPKESFTMQKIYDVLITYVSSEKITSDDGSEYTKYVYMLEYKILHNNGTFRKDIGEGSKRQYFTINNSSGELLIDSITTVNY